MGLPFQYLHAEKIDVMSIITLVGGSVGGYITFAGGHRLLDAGISGEENLDQVNRSSLMGIGITSLMRILLFLVLWASLPKD